MNSEETQNQAGQAAYLERAKALGINPANQVQVSATSGKDATPKTASVMDASLLGTPALKVPETTPVSTVASGIGGMASSIAESSAKAVTDSISADKANKEAELKDSKSLIKSLQEKALNITGSRQAEEEKAQIAQKAQAISDARAEAQDASNKIIASQRAQQNEIAQLEKNLGGMSASALQGETQRINRQYAKEQADLSLISLVANTKLNNANFDLATAQSIVDKKIENQLEPLKMEMDFAREFYQENRDAFSKAEDREFQNNALMAERAYNTEKANLERISALQLEAAKNGAPSSVIRAIGSAKTVQEAIAKTGGFAVSATDRVKLGGGSDTGISSTAQAVIDNPNLFNNLTPTVKGQVITQLQSAGYDTTPLGAKPMSDTAIQAINQSNTALTSIDELRSIIQNNQDKIGPITGFAALNPYSESRKIQADLDRVRQQVGKALEGGVLRKEDEDKYKKILATITDTPSTALYKLDQLQTNIQKSIDDYQALQLGAGKSSSVTSSLNKKGTTTTGTTSTGNSFEVIKK